MATTFLPTPSQPPADIGAAPPSWVLQAKGWMFVVAPLKEPINAGDGANPNNTPEVLQNLPAGAYHPFESIHPSALEKTGVPSEPQQCGGIPEVVIMRYEESPVGPYDELIYIGGKFTHPQSGVASNRITSIYVSSEASVWNGRNNWNIPKHVARFEWKTTGSATALSVYHPTEIPKPFSSSVPFFTATLTSSRLPTIPIHTSSTGIFAKAAQLVQPPLLSSHYPPDSHLGRLVIATDDEPNGRQNPWLVTVPAYKGRLGLAWISPNADSEEMASFGDGVGFPGFKPWRMGAYLEGSVDFPASTLPPVSGSKKLD